VIKYDNFLIEVRPALIYFLDYNQYLLEKISPELGVTDSISGKSIFEINS